MNVISVTEQKRIKIAKLLSDYAEVKEYLESLRSQIEQEFKDYPYDKLYSEAGTISWRKPYILKTFNWKDVVMLALNWGIPDHIMDELMHVTVVPRSMVIECNKNQQ